MGQTDIRVAGDRLPIQNIVYLVEDPGDATRMLGTSQHVYTTFQAAYTAADALSTISGLGTLIRVGKTSSAVGDVTLTADWNSAVTIEGINFYESIVGNILGDNNVGSAYNIQTTLNNVQIGGIYSRTMGPGAFAGASVDLSGSSFHIAAIDISQTHATSTGPLGTFTYGTDLDSGSIIENLLINSTSALNDMGYLQISVADITIGNIAMSGRDGTNGALQVNNMRCTGTVSITQDATAPANMGINLQNSDINTIIWNSAGPAVNSFMFNTQITNFTFVNVAPAGSGVPLYMNRCSFSIAGGGMSTTSTATGYLLLSAVDSMFNTINNLSARSKFTNCTFWGAIIEIGTLCVFNSCAFQGGVGGVAAGITSTPAVTVTANNTTFAGAPGSTVTLIEKAPTQRNTGAFALNVTGTLTAAQAITGYITSTTGAAVTATLPTATALAQALNATAGQTFNINFHNTGGANTLTVAVNTGITVTGTIVITGSATLTVAPGEIGVFRVLFTSATTAKIFRVS